MEIKEATLLATQKWPRTPEPQTIAVLERGRIKFGSPELFTIRVSGKLVGIGESWEDAYADAERRARG